MYNLETRYNVTLYKNFMKIFEILKQTKKYEIKFENQCELIRKIFARYGGSILNFTKKR